MSEPAITFGVNESGHIVYKATNEGVLLSKEEAECVASYISELKALAHDLWKGLDCGCRCAMYDECKHPYNDECLMAERMAALGLLDGDAE